MEESVTSVDFLPVKKDNNTLVLIGLENGFIHLFKTIEIERKYSIALVYTFPLHFSFGGKVHRLKSYKNVQKDSTQVNIAGCGDDHTVRIFSLNLELIK